jgi:N6-adenosine-specific RNA methylase IME4
MPEPATVESAQAATLAARVVCWADTIDDVAALDDARARLAAIEQYLKRRDGCVAAELARATRMVEVRIGQVLGPAELGRNQHSEDLFAIKSSDMPHRVRHDFRMMAAHADDPAVADAIEKGASRAEVLRVCHRAEIADSNVVDLWADVDVDVFPTIVIDPPWRYDNRATRGAAENHYPTMDMDELRALDVPAADDAHLYLWVTNPFLREGLELCTTWGFTYKTLLTWTKPQIGTGNYFRSATEHIIFGLRGSMPTARNDVPTWFTADRQRHSQKPEAFYDLVESCSPGPRLEMFARRRRIGWSVWGNEASVR